MALPDQVFLLSRAIRQKGQAEAESIRSQAESQAQGIILDTRQQVQHELERRLAGKKRDAMQQARKFRDNANLRARRMLLEAREELMQELVGEAQRQLERMREGGGYGDLLQSIALQAISELPGEKVWIQVRVQDQGLVSEDWCQVLAGLSDRRVGRHPEPAAITGGCLVYSADRRLLVDFSFAALLKRSQPRLMELVAQEMLEEA